MYVFIVCWGGIHQTDMFAEACDLFNPIHGRTASDIVIGQDVDIRNGEASSAETGSLTRPPLAQRLHRSKFRKSIAGAAYGLQSECSQGPSRRYSAHPVVGQTSTGCDVDVVPSVVVQRDGLESGTLGELVRLGTDPDGSH